MAQARATAFNPSSPHSSTGNVDSFKNDGTPDTRLTAFSPDEGSARSSKFYNSLTSAASDPRPLRFQGKTGSGFRSSLSHAEKDPFISTTSTSSVKRERGLSPTASAFQPVSGPFGASNQLQNFNLAGNDAHFEVNRPIHAGPASFAHGAGVTLSRYVVLSSASNRIVNPSDAEALFSHLEKLGFSFRAKRYFHSNGNKVYVRFTDIRDACMVFSNARNSSPDWQVEFVRSEHWQLVNPGSHADLANEGQVSLVIVIGTNCALNGADIEATVYRLLNSAAGIYGFWKQAGSSDDLVRIMVEFCDVDSVVPVVKKFNGFNAEGITLYLSLKKQGLGQSHAERAADSQPPYSRRNSLPDISSAFQALSLGKPSHPPGNLTASGRPSPGHVGMPLTPQVGMYPPVYHPMIPSAGQYVVEQFQRPPPVPFHLPHNLAAFSPMYQPATPGPLVQFQTGYAMPRPPGFTRPDARRQNALRVNRSPYHSAAGHHNHVDIGNIRDGADVRTTIMLRNIPNKVDQAMLKRIIDESSWGKYDFMYLRIDFANDCNVGYAFINFVDPLDIIDFVEARGNQRWNCFKSDKVAEISYATIQGKDCLVQKFRNSSVMLEPPHYRPKLYYTTNGPHPELAGQEEMFPGPDNQSKMKRSCENAEHVGLFTPNAGQHFRDEQRRRRSQYDRGTRLAAMEEYDYDTNFQLYPRM